MDRADLPRLVVELGELDHPEVTGVKIVRFLRRHKNYRAIVEVPGYAPGMITSSGASDDEL